MAKRHAERKERGFRWEPAGLLDLSTDGKWDAWMELTQLSPAELRVALHAEAVDANDRALAADYRLLDALSDWAEMAWKQFLDEHPELADT